MDQSKIEASLAKVMPFTMKDEDGGWRRGASANGQAALEFAPDGRTVTLFVSVPKNDPVVIAQNAAMLVQLLQEVFPNWKKSQAWLNEQMGAKKSEIKIVAMPMSQLISLRKTEMGAFLTVEPVEVKVIESNV